MVHFVVRSDTRPFSGPIYGTESNPAAHGNVCVTEHCRCGATRSRNVNGLHEEQGSWDMPHSRPNIAACAATVEDCRKYLEIAAGSVLGREILNSVCGSDAAEAVIRSPRRGDPKSTRYIAEMVHTRLQ